MKLKKVLAGLRKEYRIDEIHIITPTRVIFSGEVEKWDNTPVELLLYKKKVENAEVTNKMMFNGYNAFIFVPEIE